MIVILLLLLSEISTLEYNFHCPHQSQRRFRASIFCNGSQISWYSCLYDVQSRMYVEDCSLKPDFVKTGEKYIISGKRANEPCSEGRYQPLKFWSNESTNCILKKSLCNEVGQMVYENGTSDRDVTCRCDHSKSYAFLSNTTNKCFCLPTEEDCTCHFKQCPKGKHLFPDYKCRNRFSPGDTYCKFNVTYSQDLNNTIKHQSTLITVHRGGKVYKDTTFVFVLCLLVVLLVLVRGIFISRLSQCKCLHIQHEEHIKRDVIELFEIRILANWKEMKAALYPDDILKDLLKLNFINEKEYSKISEQDYRNRNKEIMKIFATQYMESRSGEVNGNVFKNLLKKQQQKVERILSRVVVFRRWPKRDPDHVQRIMRLETAANMIDNIELEVIMEELMTCLIFNAHDYTKITEASMSASERKKCFRSLIISYLHKGSFECLLKYLIRTSDPAFERLTEMLIPAIYLHVKRDFHSEDCLSEANKNILSANLWIYIPENNDFNLTISKHIRVYLPWFIYEFGMYPTIGNDEGNDAANDTRNGIIYLESVCPDAFDRIKRSFGLVGLAELLERLMCIEEVMNTLTTENETVNVKLKLVCEENNNKDNKIEYTSVNMDEVSILKTNRSYLVNEMEMSIIIEKFKKYQEIAEFEKQTVKRTTKSAGILDTIIHNPNTYLKLFKRTIEENETLCNIRKRLDESRYVFRKTIATATLRNNIIQNIIHLKDLPLDYEDLRKKFEDGDILLQEKSNILETDSDVFNSFIIKVLKSDRDALLTFVDYIFQIGEIIMAKKLLIEQPYTIDLDSQGKACHFSMNLGGINENNIVLEKHFYIKKVEDVLRDEHVEEMDN